MTCAKQRVICRIETTSGEVVTGENWCRNPQSSCPREGIYGPGDGYHLCREICDQVGHAEQVAVANLQGRTPVSASLEGHTYACDNCKTALVEAGVQEIHINGEIVQLTPPWTQCPCCDDFLCNVHGDHAFECPCPPIEDWVDAGYDPYLSDITPALIFWVHTNTTNE